MEEWCVDIDFCLDLFVIEDPKRKNRECPFLFANFLLQPMFLRGNDEVHHKQEIL